MDALTQAPDDWACATCRFYLEADEKPPAENRGFCRRRSPAALSPGIRELLLAVLSAGKGGIPDDAENESIGAERFRHAEWPAVWHDDFCGDWRKRDG